MAKIIISYRRADSQAMAGRIFDRLIAHYGEKAVFMDIDAIPFGIDFRKHIADALAQGTVLVAWSAPTGWAEATSDAIGSTIRPTRCASSLRARSSAASRSFRS
jgi:hypothetical protein